MRAFLAVFVPDSLRAALSEAQDDLRRTGAEVSWVPAGNLHVTLKFLGEIPEGATVDLSGLPPAFDTEMAGVGEFGGRVVWAGCRGDLTPMKALAAAAEEAGERLGVARERRPFAAHVTLGRVKSHRGLRDLRKRLDKWRDRVFGPWRVEKAALVASDLGPEGAAYTILREYPLGP